MPAVAKIFLIKTYASCLINEYYIFWSKVHDVDHVLGSLNHAPLQSYLLQLKRKKKLREKLFIIFGFRLPHWSITESGMESEIRENLTL